VTSHPSSRLSAVVALAAVLALAPSGARADFATTNLQFLDGWSFNDPAAGGNDVRGGQMYTVTLNHFSTWAYGDNFFFADLMQGEYEEGTKSHVYSEWHPRLSLMKLLGVKGKALGIFRDAGLAFELNLGNAFQAWMAGVGCDIPVGPGLVSVNVYYRYDELQIPTGGGNAIRSYNHTWQVSPSWSFPFKVAGASFLFSGFVDVNGVEELDGSDGVEVMAQPQLVVDVLGLAGGPAGKLFAGVEWYLHHHPSNEELGAPDDLNSVPQALIQWNLH
jgi:nucleoside-specific outer membrane channel protein Tsx